MKELTFRIIYTSSKKEYLKTDKEIIRAISEGDPMNCVDQLYQTEYPKLKRYIIKNSGNEEDAKDLFQESIMTLFSHIKLKKFKEEYSIGGFLYIVGCNAWKKRCKKRKLEIISDDIPAENFSENLTYNHLFNQERQQAIKRIFSKLGDNCTKLLKAVIYDNKSHREIMSEFGYSSEATSRTSLFKCKKRLAKIAKENTSLESYLKEELKYEY